MTTRAGFVISSDEESLDFVTEAMGIVPNKTRRKSEFNCQAIAHSEWILSTSSKNYKSICEPLYELIGLLSNKVDTINYLRKTNNISTLFVVSVHSETDSLPELTLPPDIVGFAGSMNAEFGFDIYTNERC